jgi:hypothetical protein
MSGNSINCFGSNDRETGQRREPTPPARITGINIKPATLDCQNGMTKRNDIVAKYCLF